MNNIKLVFDIDDTICNNKNRDYENAIPFKDVIDKINKLHKQGAKITLYTSRGMVSCNGDLEKIIKKNKPILEKWLKKNKVEYDELIFGKPLGDMYVDDKAINVNDFINQDFKILNGHSGYKVIFKTLDNVGVFGQMRPVSAKEGEGMEEIYATAQLAFFGGEDPDPE